MEPPANAGSGTFQLNLERLSTLAEEQLAPPNPDALLVRLLEMQNLSLSLLPVSPMLPGDEKAKALQLLLRITHFVESQLHHGPKLICESPLVHRHHLQLILRFGAVGDEQAGQVDGLLRHRLLGIHSSSSPNPFVVPFSVDAVLEAQRLVCSNWDAAPTPAAASVPILALQFDDFAILLLQNPIARVLPAWWQLLAARRPRVCSQVLPLAVRTLCSLVADRIPIQERPGAVWVIYRNGCLLGSQVGVTRKAVLESCMSGIPSPQNSGAE